MSCVARDEKSCAGAFTAAKYWGELSLFAQWNSNTPANLARCRKSQGLATEFTAVEEWHAGSRMSQKCHLFDRNRFAEALELW